MQRSLFPCAALHLVSMLRDKTADTALYQMAPDAGVSRIHWWDH